MFLHLTREILVKYNFIIEIPFEMVKILLILSLVILNHGLHGGTVTPRSLTESLRFYAISSRKCNFHQDTGMLCELKSDIHQTLPGNPPPKYEF